MKKHFWPTKPHQLNTKNDGLITFIDYKSKRFRILYGVIIFLLLVAVLTALLPIGILFLSSYKTTLELYATPFQFFPQLFEFKKIFAVWNEVNFGKYFLNTLIVVIGAAFFAVIINGLLAYGVAIVKPRGYRIAFTLIMASYMIPTVLAIVPLYQSIVDLRLINNYLPLWLMFGANAYYFIIFKNYFDAIPKSLIEAARVDGASELRIFFSIIIPMSKSIIGLVAIFAVTAAWSDFLLPYLVLQNSDLQTIMVLLFLKSSDAQFAPDKLLMLSLISIIPQIVIFFVFQKQITGSTLNSGLKE